MRRVILFLTAFATSFAFAGGSFDLSINDDTVRLEHDATRVGTGAHITAGFLYREDQGYLASIGFNAVDGESTNSELIGGMGAKLFFYEIDEEVAVSVGLGGFARYYPIEFGGVGLEGSYYYSPDVISFNETSSFYELSARIGFRVLPQSTVFLGIHNVEAEFEEYGDQDLVRAGVVGFRINY